MDSMFGAISVLILGCGLYTLYAYIKMKNGGPINEVILLGKGYDERKCKDRDAFVKKSLPAMLAFGLATVFYGAIDVYHFYVSPIAILDWIAMGIFFVALVWYMIYTTKLKKQYF